MIVIMKNGAFSWVGPIFVFFFIAPPQLCVGSSLVKSKVWFNFHICNLPIKQISINLLQLEFSIWSICFTLCTNC